MDAGQILQTALVSFGLATAGQMSGPNNTANVALSAFWPPYASEALRVFISHNDSLTQCATGCLGQWW